MVDKSRCHRNRWTIAEINFVEQHYGQISVVEIGEKLGRTANVNAKVYDRFSPFLMSAFYQ